MCVVALMPGWLCVCGKGGRLLSGCLAAAALGLSEDQCILALAGRQVCMS